MSPTAPSMSYVSTLAQVSAETGLFRQSIEEPNKFKSSQSTYKGRGIIQLTGSKDNTGYYNNPGTYKDYADYIGDQSIVSNPDKISHLYFILMNIVLTW
ncbi:hypothetical protein HN014_15825 [Aquimarina sp. TRL1]|uniref:hypothetical protein n=1 Tax=Aquimarina sp. (strain TRL1) TaxID=2736252 RepID=UPI0015885404|nr:hypothetical protein [Aquimarina sp. TRL1]QKX06317.1 hypothetical protein HN014_15825 [Aquimarina sp. TRL1]